MADHIKEDHDGMPLSSHYSTYQRFVSGRQAKTGIA